MPVEDFGLLCPAGVSLHMQQGQASTLAVAGGQQALNAHMGIEDILLKHRRHVITLKPAQG